MGSGCLAPKPIQGDLTCQLIEQLHQLPPNTTKQQKYVQKEAVYSKEKQKIFKKAPLRKLIDYLSSHRHKLIDSLSHNIKICVEKGTQYSWTVGLVILERVILMATQGVLRQATTPKIQHILKNKSQNGSQSDTLRDMKTLKTQSQRQRQNKSSYLHIHSNPSETIVNQIMSPRFESILFDTINTCLQEPSLYKQCLRILCDYLQAKPKSLNSEDKVKTILLTLLNNIKVDYQGETTLQAYYQMLLKLKDKVVLSMCDELKVIIKMWIYLKNTANSSKSITLINSCDNKIGWVQMIIGRFLTSSLDGMQYSSMIKLLMEIQDQYFFDLSLEFESLYVYILSQSELGPHFLKALFLDYLRYAVMGNFGQPIFNQLSQHSRQLLSCNQTSYSNIRQKQTRKKIYELIKRWLIEKRYISISQIIEYNSSLFIYTFLHNTGDQTLKNVCALLLQQTNTQQKIILNQTVLEFYQRKQSPSFLRNLLFAFHKPLGSSLKIINLKQNISRFAIDTTHLTSSQAIQLYLVMMQLYCRFDKQTIVLYVQQVCELFGSIVSFLHQDKGDKAKLIPTLLQFIQFIVTVDLATVAVTCYHQILRIVERKVLEQEQLNTINKLLAQIKQIFQQNNVQDHQDTKTNTQEQNDQNHFVGDYSCYFKQLVNQNNQSKSKLTNCNQFEKAASVIKSEIREEESIQDILQMINY